jgi:hypothetical protein
LKVSFLYNAQLHQVAHSLPLALELAEHHPDIRVEVAGVTRAHLDFARRLAQRYGSSAPIGYVRLRQPMIARLKRLLTGLIAPSKRKTLATNLDYFAGLDAIVTPEWTSLALRRLGVPRTTKLILTGHGAGDRAVTVNSRISEFDFVVVPGAKLERRMLEMGRIRPGAYVAGIYTKFDLLHRASLAGTNPFDNGRPTVLYNPHFERALSSWQEVGTRVLDHFAANPRWNLIFAPHVRLFEKGGRRAYRAFRRYQGLPNIHIDLGGERCHDMSYTLSADVYLGDVSSQVAEFLIRPRPCLFLNPHRFQWRDDPNFRFWELGPVLDDVTGLELALANAISSHASYRELQVRYFEDSFGDAARVPSGRRGADAIADFLRGGRPASADVRIPPLAA